MISLLRPAPDIARLPDPDAGPAYRRLRAQVFVGIFLGYVASYLIRKNLSLAMPDILEARPELTKAMLGVPLTWLSLTYGVSKFVMGTVSDRSNPRGFLFVGLLLSALIQSVCGLDKSIYGSLATLSVLQAANGWVQGMCHPPCGKTIVHWFGRSERGRAVSLWNVSHNVGAGLAPTVALAAVTFSGDWGAKFWGNALLAVALAVAALVLMRDTPQSCGLPPIEAHSGDVPKGYSEDSERILSTREILFQHVFTNKWLWAIAFANVFVYFVRYGIGDWIPTYLKAEKGFDFAKTSWAAAAYEYAAIPGTLLCGWVSDKVFRSQRAPATILFMGLTMLGVLLYWFNRTGPIWIDTAALITIGFLIYGPVMVIGLHALDLVPKKAAGTAAGFTGFFGYVFGSAPAGAGVGWIADRFGWNGVFVTMVACCVLTMVFSALTLGERKAKG
jgi:OPA family glycerol-3-phosphate transporter-like MFS transporter